jgi:hypothetical protein
MSVEETEGRLRTYGMRPLTKSSTVSSIIANGSRNQVTRSST